MARAAHDIPPFVNSPQRYSNDLLNFIVPTTVTGLGRFSWFVDIARRFTGNTFEQGAFLGLPLLTIIVLYAGRTKWNGMALLGATGVLVVASLGPVLWINGWLTRITGPWVVFTHVPLISGALPARFSLYISLATGLVAALWLSEAVSFRERLARYVLAALACLCLWPNPAAVAWSRVPLLPFFEPAQVEATLGRNANVLILPFSLNGPGMIWQWQSGMRFTQSGGYASMVPLSFSQQPMVQGLLTGVPMAGFTAAFTIFCAEHSVAAVLIGPGTPPGLVLAVAALGWENEVVGGVHVFRVPHASQ
jgi:hypothetical protein